MESLEGHSFLRAPPLSVVLEQQMVETATKTSDGANKKSAFLTQSLFGVTCSVRDESLLLYPLEVNMKLDTPTAGM